MSTTTPAKRTRRTTAPAVVIPAPSLDDQLLSADIPSDVRSQYDELRTASAAATTVAEVQAVVARFETAETLLTTVGFIDRIERSSVVGRFVRDMYRVGNGPDAEDSPSAATLMAYVGVRKAPDGGGSYLGRNYSALGDCIALSSVHTMAAFADYLSTFREAGGVAPEQVGEYLTHARRFAKGTTTYKGDSLADALVKKHANARKAREDAQALRSSRATAVRNLAAVAKRSKPTDVIVPGCPLTLSQWQAMDADTLDAVSDYARKVASDKRAAAKRSSSSTPDAGSAASQTGK